MDYLKITALLRRSIPLINSQFKMFSVAGSEEAKMVNFEEMKIYENSDKVLIIDVRNPEEIQSTSKIGGSINVPLDNLEQALKSSPSEFKLKFGKDKPAPDFPVIFSCKSGKRAAKALEVANTLNYKNAKFYKGSWDEWEEKMKQKGGEQ